METYTVRMARKESKTISRNTTHAKSKIQKVVFLAERIFELHLRKEKPIQVVFKPSFQYIGILGLHCTLHLLKTEAPSKVFCNPDLESEK